ncbi:MAG: bifunctional DNA primase/polymerase [Propionibacteriaceae bacterium]|nr:bifunctional DNA primase/polymerase [Propionibacteriaceae bacterium]
MTTEMPRALRAALAYANRGWRVLPLRPEDKRPLGRLVPHGSKNASSIGDDLLRWWSDEPDAGVAIATGADSGVWVLDIDGPVGAVVWWHWEATHEPVHTLAQRTGRLDGGRQLFFLWPNDRVIRPSAGILPGIDVRGEGAYVVVPPSIHPSGRRYRWEGRVDVASAPDALLTMVGATIAQRQRTASNATRTAGYTTPYGREVVNRIEDDLSACGRGGRDVLAYRSAVRLLELESSGELAHGETEGALRRALQKNGYMTDQRKGRGEGGLQRILRQASEKSQPKGAPR